MNDSPNKILIRILRSIPIELPLVGHIIAEYLNSQEREAAKASILALNRQQHLELLSELGELRGRFDVLQAYFSVDGKNSHIGSKLTIVIPCGGESVGLFPMTEVMPKCLVIVNDRSVLQHIIDSFAQHIELFEKVIVATTGHHAAIEQNVLQGGYDGFVECLHVESKSVPDCLLKLQSQIKTSRFLLHYHDILIPDPNWKYVLQQYDIQQGQHSQIGTLLCSDYYPIGIGVITEGEPGLLEKLDEKPKRLSLGYANIAVAVFETVAINKYCMNADKNFFSETIRRMQVGNEKVCLHKVGTWFHVQDWTALYRLQRENLFRPRRVNPARH